MERIWHFLNFSTKILLVLLHQKLGRQAPQNISLASFQPLKNNIIVFFLHTIPPTKVSTLFCLFSGGAAVDGEGGLAGHGQGNLLLVTRNLHT